MLARRRSALRAIELLLWLPILLLRGLVRVSVLLLALVCLLRSGGSSRGGELGLLRIWLRGVRRRGVLELLGLLLLLDGSSSLLNVGLRLGTHHRGALGVHLEVGGVG